jgi:hypothetical protein
VQALHRLLNGSTAWISCEYGGSNQILVTVESYPTQALTDKRFNSLNVRSATTTSQIQQWQRPTGTGRLIVSNNSYGAGSGGVSVSFNDPQRSDIIINVGCTVGCTGDQLFQDWWLGAPL